MRALSAEQPADPTYQFEHFRLNTRRRILYTGRDVVPLTGKLFDTLRFLIEQRGRIVSKEELLAQVWPDTIVEEGNLARNVSTLRKTLCDSPETHRYILTVPGIGYRFVAPVVVVADDDPAAPWHAGAVGPLPLNEPGVHTILADSGSALAAHLAAGDASDAAIVVPGAESRGRSGSTLNGVAARRWLTFRAGRSVLSGTAVIVASILLGVIGSASLSRAKGHGVRSLAVLPLANLSPDAGHDYFADGMTEAVISRLSSIGDLRVISRTSVLQFRDTRRPLADIAASLDVDAVVVGSVTHSGDRVRITAQLVHARGRETSLWSGTFERDLQDVLTLQADVAHSISRSIALTLTRDEKRRVTESRPVAPAVYEHYLKGRFELSRPTRASPRDALAHFEAALRMDPVFAPGYMGLSRAYRELGTNFRGAFPAVEMLPKAIAAAEKALQLDPDLAEAHALLAGARHRLWQWSDAEGSYRQSLQLEPNSAAAHVGLAHLVAARGRLDEAVQLARRARALDPLSPAVAANVCWTLYLARHYSEAIRECRTSLELQPDNHSGLWYLGVSLREASRFDEALAVLEHGLTISERSPGMLGSVVNAYAGSGRRSDALRVLNELHARRSTQFVPPDAFVHAYAGLGDIDRAFEWLERAYAERSNVVWQLKIAPTLDPLRADSRFTTLLRRVGLE